MSRASTVKIIGFEGFADRLKVITNFVWTSTSSANWNLYQARRVLEQMIEERDDRAAPLTWCLEHYARMLRPDPLPSLRSRSAAAYRMKRKPAGRGQWSAA